LESLNVLSRLGDPRGLDAVLRLASDQDADAAVREPAIRALAGFKDPRAADGLFDILNNAALPLSDRRAASRGIEVMCNPATRERIKDSIPKLEDQQMRVSLIAALGWVGTKDDRPFLAELARDEDPGVAGAARDAIQELEMRE
jgi:HEAT repeat protein